MSTYPGIGIIKSVDGLGPVHAKIHDVRRRRAQWKAPDDRQGSPGAVAAAGILMHESLVRERSRAMPTAASSFIAFAFAALAVAVAIGFVIAHAAAARRLGCDWGRTRRVAVLTGLGAAAWMALTGAAAARGDLARFDARPPPLLALFVGVVAGSGAIGFSRVGERLALGLPVAVLVGAQAFRLPLELVMHRAVEEGVVPVQMSFSGWNFDIVTGITALGVATLAWLGRASRVLIVAWNAIGIALLTTILVLALVSTPAIHAFGQDARSLNTFVAYVPFVWLPSVIVAGAIVGHIVLTRRLLEAADGRQAGRNA